MSEEKSYTSSELLNLGREVAANEPEMLRKYAYRVAKPDPEIYHIIYLYPLRSYFCERLSISIFELIQSTTLRKTFIAVATKLFNPEYISGYKNELKDNFAEQLGELLHCDRTWISQHAGYAKDILNPRTKGLANTYQQERKDIEEMAPELFERIQNEIKIVSRKEGKVAELFKQEAS
jgi:hypothetical protein